MINMTCVAYGYKMEKDKKLEQAFKRLANALEEIQDRLTFNARFALRDARDAVAHSGADGVRAHGEHLLQEIDDGGSHRRGQPPAWTAVQLKPAPIILRASNHFGGATPLFSMRDDTDGQD